MDQRQLFRFSFSVMECGPLPNGWQMIRAKWSDEMFGIGIPPIEYALQPGDIVELYCDNPFDFQSHEPLYMQINQRGALIPWKR